MAEPAIARSHHRSGPQRGLVRIGPLRLRLMPIVLVTATLIGVPPPGWVAAQEPSGCAFATVFELLRSRIGEQRVGTCVADAPVTPDGTVAQQTSTGLLVWGAADGRPAFTDGATTWLLGPGGLVWQRDNGERFDWEPGSAAAGRVTLRSGDGPATPLPCLPVVERWGRTDTGVTVEVDNPCGTEEVFGLSVVLAATAGGQPLAATPEIVWQAPTDDRREIGLASDMVGDAVTFLPDATPSPTPPAGFCLDVGATHCLVTDSWLAGAVQTLRGVEAGRTLLREAADGYVVLRWGTAPFDSLALYDLSDRTVTLDARRLAAANDWERAALLAHELQHAADQAAGRPFDGDAACLAREVDATLVEGQVWSALWRGHLSVATSAIQDDLNRLARDLPLGPQGLARSLLPRYLLQCGPVALPLMELPG